MSNKIEVEPSQIDLEKLKGLLKHGDVKKIAERTDHSAGYVAQVLNPGIKNKFSADIVIAAVEFVKGRAKISLDPTTAAYLTKNGNTSVPKSA